MPRDLEYRGDDFSMQVQAGFREIVFVTITRDGASRRLEGERIGDQWQGNLIDLGRDVDPADVAQIVRDLETGLGALGEGYVISRTVAVEEVPEAEQQAAIAELETMGYEVERSGDRRQVSLKRKPGARLPDSAKAAQEGAQRMQKLIQALSGLRSRVELLAASKDFASDADRYIPG